MLWLTGIFLYIWRVWWFFFNPRLSLIVPLTCVLPPLIFFWLSEISANWKYLILLLLFPAVVEEAFDSINTSRRCIMVISPAYVKSWVTSFDLKAMIDKAERLKREVIPIKLDEVSSESESESDLKLLEHIMENGSCLTWPEQNNVTQTEKSRISSKMEKKMEKKKEVFFKELMLRMPPRHLSKKSHKYNKTMSQVPFVSQEERKPSFEAPQNFTSGFPSAYPDLNSALNSARDTHSPSVTDLNSSDFSSNSTNMATVTIAIENGDQKCNGTTKMYPVIT